MKSADEQTGGEIMVADQMLAGLDLSECKTEIERHELVYGYGHTGRYIKEQQPEKFARIMLGLNEGMAIEHIAKLCGCSHNTIDALIPSEFPGGRAAYDAKLIDQLQRISRQCADGILRLIPKCEDPQKLAVVMGITEEKLAMRRGAPSLNLNFVVTHLDSKEKWFEKFEEMKRQAAERQAVGTVVEEGTERHLPNAVPDNATPALSECRSLEAPP